METELQPQKLIRIYGGGTVEHVRPHTSLASVAYGTTARALAVECMRQMPSMLSTMHLTRMAGGVYGPETVQDLAAMCVKHTRDPRTRVVFFSCAVVDFVPVLDEPSHVTPSGQRLSSRESHSLSLLPRPKLINIFRSNHSVHARKDIFLVGFKATAGAAPEEQYLAGLKLLKDSSCNLVLANDVTTKNNMIICPEEAVYHESTDRADVLGNLVDMVNHRTHLTFTRSTVVDGKPVPWDSPEVPSVLRTLVDYCITCGAYKQFQGVTAGHFAAKLDDRTFLTSRRRTDFNDMKSVGLVRVKTDGPDSVIAYGSKPSVGGQSQRIIFTEHPDADCVLHFHCPLKPGSEVPVVSQREFECGSHQCGQNTSSNLKRFGNILAVMLDQHGPNLVFHHDIDAQEVINFIEANFDLQGKTGGYQLHGTPPTAE